MTHGYQKSASSREHAVSAQENQMVSAMRKDFYNSVASLPMPIQRH
jgi:hypothetical protein